MKDYYKVLGIDSSASKDEVKKAFKKLAKQHHPDINKGNPKSEEKFKEISEAYEVLSRDDERRKYDAARSGGHNFRFDGFSQDGPFRDFFSQGSQGGSDFFEDILRGFGGFGGSSSRQGSPFSGFESIFGGGSRQRPSAPNATLKVPLDTAVNGGKIQVSGLPGGTQTIDVPAGTANNSVLKVNSNQGTIHLKISVEDEAPFKVNGKNIETTITINLAQALLGSKVKLKSPARENFILTIPKGSKPGDVLKLKHQGLGGGDLLVKLDIDFPKNMTEEQIDLFKAFAEEMGWRY